MKVAFSSPLSNSSDGNLQELVPIRDRNVEYSRRLPMATTSSIQQLYLYKDR
jgi:hypothetical protein